MQCNKIRAVRPQLGSLPSTASNIATVKLYNRYAHKVRYLISTVCTQMYPRCELDPSSIAAHNMPYELVGRLESYLL